MQRVLVSLALVLGVGMVGCNKAVEEQRPAGEAVTAKAVDVRSQVTLESDQYVATLDAESTALAHYTFHDKRYQRDGRPIDLVTTDKPQFLPLAIKVDGQNTTSGWQAEQLGPKAVRFTRTLGDLTLVRKLEVGAGNYQLWSTLRVYNRGKSQHNTQVSIEGNHYLRRADESGGFLAGRSAMMASGMCMTDEKPQRFEREDIVEEKPVVTGKVLFGSVDTVYFAQAIAADGAPFERCSLVGSERGGTADEPDGALLTVSLSYAPTRIEAGAFATFRQLVYLGPKSPKELSAAGHELRGASYVGGLPGVDKIAIGLVALLAYIQQHVVGNWGLAIILLTLSVKLVLYPLTAKSFQSIAAMRRVKPAIDEINAKYADDREKKGAAMMALYKEHKINPFGGCLPQLLQLPIWWALYTSLSTNVELFKRPFFGFWTDLAAPDPFYVLPLALGLLMWVQQKITPSTMDPAQAKMMLYLMPAMITSFMLFLPAGLCLYMFTNSVLSIAQQRFIEYRLAHKHPATQVASLGAADSSSDTRNGSSPRRT